VNDKITSAHLERAAYVYIRQSTLHQVRHHLESKRRQYDLKLRAQELGFRQVEVIDEDLGVSGTGTKERPGFARLLASVCEGKVGAVLALEASRLARNNRDWHHLIDLCVLTNTLVIDAEGIYDARILNDRLLLGLKGTMSEFELGLLRQRAQEAFRQKIQRGEVLFEVPIGYHRTEADTVEMTPDRQVQEAIRGVFAHFRRFGSVRQVLLWYHQEKIPLCTGRRGANKLWEITWKLPVYNRILAILTNPIYAGAFAYGRTKTRSHIIEGRSRKSPGHAVPLEEWAVLIRDHHPGYITWEEYMQNQKQLADNTTKYHLSGKGAAKTGPALLAGLLRCARCGRKFHVRYSGVNGRVPRYHCCGAHINHGTEFCISFGGLRADEAIVRSVLEALQPVGIEAALRATESLGEVQDQKIKALTLALEKARYEADRARRQYDAVEPENRLVAAELEARWNTSLQALSDAEKTLNDSRSVAQPLTEAERKRLLELGSQLPELWVHPQTSVALKKRVLRTVIEEIICDVDDKASELQFRIHWIGGTHTIVRVQKNRTGKHGRMTERPVIDIVRELAPLSSDQAITSILNRLGYETGAGNSWTEARVKTLRVTHNIPAMSAQSERIWVTLAESAAELKVSAGTIRKLIEKKILPAKQVVRGAPWVINRADLQLPEVQNQITAVYQGKRSPRHDLNQTKMALL
jgi:DNA invertase Pin-like site-specific DNA recombinase